MLRHVLRVGPQPCKDIREFARQNLAGIHRQELPDLHRRAAQMSKLMRNLERVGGRQEEIAQARPLAMSQLPRPIEHHAAGDTGGHRGEARQARHAPARNGQTFGKLVVRQKRDLFEGGRAELI